MRLSINLTNQSWAAGKLREELESVVRVADRAGLDTVWLPDHVMQADPNLSPEAEQLEAYTTLGFLACCTERIRLGTAVSSVAFRQPAVLVKAVTTLDVLSGGRAWLGIGCGYPGAEAERMGLAMLPTAGRFDQLEDTLRLAKHMWSGEFSPMHGKYVRAAQPVSSPQPVTKPHPPILIGGMGEQKTLRLVARYGDACNLFDIPGGDAVLRHKLDVLAGHCADVGRDPAEIEKTIGTRLDPGETAEQFASRCAAMAQLGMQHAIVLVNEPWGERTLETMAATAPLVRDL